MKSMLFDTIKVACPYCGERFTADIDCTQGDQSYYEDCQICCHPIQFIVRLNVHGELGEVLIQRDND